MSLSTPFIRDGAAKRGGFQFTASNGVTYRCVKADPKPNTSREVLRGEDAGEGPLCQDFVPDCASVSMTIIFEADKAPLKQGDTFSYQFDNISDEAVTWIVDQPQLSIAPEYHQQTFTAWESISGIST